MVSYIKGETQKTKILRRIFGPKGNENGEWRRIHNDELHSLYRSPNIDRVIKSRRLRWAGYVARMEENLQERDHLEGPGIDGRIMLEFILKKYTSMLEIGQIWWRIRVTEEPL